ncbi:hypothetical protein ACFOHS_21740 [Jhaorihella thermophila]
MRFFALLSVALMAGFGLSPVMAAMMERAGLTVNDAFFVTAALCALAAAIFFCPGGPPCAPCRWPPGRSRARRCRWRRWAPSCARPRGCR